MIQPPSIAALCHRHGAVLVRLLLLQWLLLTFLCMILFVAELCRETRINGRRDGEGEGLPETKMSHPVLSCLMMMEISKVVRTALFASPGRSVALLSPLGCVAFYRSWLHAANLRSTRALVDLSSNVTSSIILSHDAKYVFYDLARMDSTVTLADKPWLRWLAIQRLYPRGSPRKRLVTIQNKFDQ